MGYGFKKIVFAILGVASGLATLFCLGIIFTVDLNAQSPDAKPIMIILTITFGIATLILWSIKSRYSEKADFYEKARKEHPDEAWRQRESWANNEIIEWYPSQQVGLFLAYIFTLVLGGLFTYSNVHDALLAGSPVTWKYFIPVGIPLLLMPWAAKRVFLLLRRGPLKVQLDDVPATIGEPISGTITLNDGGIRLPQELTLQLLCRKVTTHQGGTSNNKVTDRAEKEALWSEKKKVQVSQPNADRNVTISFRFTPPDDLPPADIETETRPHIAWTLRLRDIYNKRMYDYAVNLPVFEEEEQPVSTS